MDAISIILASQLTRSEARSALPHAPIEPPDELRPSHSRPFRRATATALYRLAERVEPRVAPRPLIVDASAVRCVHQLWCDRAAEAYRPGGDS